VVNRVVAIPPHEIFSTLKFMFWTLQPLNKRLRQPREGLETTVSQVKEFGRKKKAQRNIYFTLNNISLFYFSCELLPKNRSRYPCESIRPIYNYSICFQILRMLKHLPPPPPKKKLMHAIHIHRFHFQTPKPLIKIIKSKVNTYIPILFQSSNKYRKKGGRGAVDIGGI
jgi:hypothetical protein